MQGSRFGPYELIAPLGTGGMAETFLAVRRGPAGFEQRVCLKRILPKHAENPALIELFLDEARLLANLRNGNIVQVYDFGEAEGSYYMALELVEGTDLQQLAVDLARRGERFTEEIALYIAGEVLTALDYAHSATVQGVPLSVVHRDVSPSNILVSVHGEVKLTDFGIAKARGRKHKTRTGQTKGKVSYMAPEQVTGEALDGRCDLFAVGIVLFELLSGVHPFDADSDLAVLNNILTGKRPSLRAVAPQVAPEVAELVEQLLAVDVRERPGCAAAALAKLPGQSSAFVAKRELSDLVARYQAAKAARRMSSAPSPAGMDPAYVGRGGTTETLPATRTPSQRVAYQSQTAARPTRSLRLPLWLGLGALGLVVAGIALLLSLRSPEVEGADTSAAAVSAEQQGVPAPVTPTLDHEQAPALVAPSAPPPSAPIAPAPSNTPAAEPSATAEPAQPARPQNTAQRVLRRSNDSTASERRVRPPKNAEAGSSRPDDLEGQQAPKPRPRTRSGLGVSADEF